MFRDYPEIDLHGMFADEALDSLDRAIRQALDSGHVKLRIVHGKGTGVLNREIREFLKYHPKVRTYQYASPHDGGEGVTVAALGARY
jgi:DNA mismatch repair protein MutS2